MQTGFAAPGKTGAKAAKRRRKAIILQNAGNAKPMRTNISRKIQSKEQGARDGGRRASRL